MSDTEITRAKLLTHNELDYMTAVASIINIVANELHLPANNYSIRKIPDAVAEFLMKSKKSDLAALEGLKFRLVKHLMPTDDAWSLSLLITTSYSIRDRVKEHTHAHEYPRVQADEKDRVFEIRRDFQKKLITEAIVSFYKTVKDPITEESPEYYSAEELAVMSESLYEGFERVIWSSKLEETFEFAFKPTQLMAIKEVRHSLTGLDRLSSLGELPCT